ncbi:MAG: DUF1667 domain-containing protein [Actinobacteria bacterium]|nr:DUF1667 domain-containing protein [Actinomycetota bacterium]
MTVKNGEIKLVPVRTSKPIRKSEWKSARDIIRGSSVRAPVRYGKILMRDFTEEKIKLITTREVGVL